MGSVGLSKEPFLVVLSAAKNLRNVDSTRVTELRASNGTPAPSPFPPPQGGGNRREGAECSIAYAEVSRRPFTSFRVTWARFFDSPSVPSFSRCQGSNARQECPAVPGIIRSCDGVAPARSASRTHHVSRSRTSKTCRRRATPALDLLDGPDHLCQHTASSLSTKPALFPESDMNRQERQA